MFREWLIGGNRYGPNGENLGPVSSEWFCRQTESEGEPFVHEYESTRCLVVEGSLASAKRSGLPVQLWGFRMRIAYESVTALETATLDSNDVVLFDLALPGRNGLPVARRLRSKVGFRTADLIAMERSRPGNALFYHQQPDFGFHLVKTVNSSELWDLLAAVEQDSLATLP
jgi:CheY-like chemotaxis protein